MQSFLYVNIFVVSCQQYQHWLPHWYFIIDIIQNGWEIIFHCSYTAHWLAQRLSHQNRDECMKMAVIPELLMPQLCPLNSNWKSSLTSWVFHFKCNVRTNKKTKKHCLCLRDHLILNILFATLKIKCHHLKTEHPDLLRFSISHFFTLPDHFVHHTHTVNISNKSLMLHSVKMNTL